MYLFMCNGMILGVVLLVRYLPLGGGCAECVNVNCKSVTILEVTPFSKLYAFLMIFF